MKIQLKGREIPRNAGRDPAFKRVTMDDALLVAREDFCGDKESLLEIFTPQEIVELVNRALYQLEYQHNAHKVRGQRQRDREKAIKQKVKELYHVSWMKATEEQIRKATEEVEKG